MTKRRIVVILGDRANYGRMKPVMFALLQRTDVEMKVVCAGTMILKQFGSLVQEVKRDGFRVDTEVYMEVEGSTPVSMAKSLGLGIIEFSSSFQHLKPDIVLLIGDRYEALAAALAASYMNLCVAHIQGGEVSGSIDESARHCITKLSHYHFPATKRAAEYLVRMGENPNTVFQVGCPCGDIALNLKPNLSRNVLSKGIGAKIDLHGPYLLIVFHPTTTKYGDERQEIKELITALAELNYPSVWFWPNIDAGSSQVSRTIHDYLETRPHWLRLVQYLSPEAYLKVLASAKCCVGNSSSFVRDASFLGTPVVLVGDRQQGRELSNNVLHVALEKAQIINGIKEQMKNGKYSASKLYGDGQSALRIASIVSGIKPYVQKKLNYD